MKQYINKVLELLSIKGTPKKLLLLSDNYIKNANKRDFIKKIPQIKYGINHKNSYGDTVLHLAVRYNRSSKIIEKLINSGACVNSVNNYANTILHSAIHQCSINQIKKLLDAGADVSVKNKNGNTALQIAIQLQKTRAIILLQSYDDSIYPIFKTGNKITGTVSGIADFGFFVHLKDGVEGLVHCSEISYLTRVEGIKQIQEIATIGQEIEVIILSVDTKKYRISLSVKQLKSHPYDDIYLSLKTGDKITGTVSQIFDFGFLVRLKDGVEGLVRCSEIPYLTRVEGIKQIQEIATIGQEIEVIILSVDTKKYRISLSVKQLKSHPYDDIYLSLKTGDKITGTVSQIFDFGFFVHLKDGVEGLVRCSEISYLTKVGGIKQIQKIVTIGQEIEVIILSVDTEKYQISLSVKQLKSHPYDDMYLNLKTGDKITGTVSGIADFGFFVRLKDGVEGLVRCSEISYLTRVGGIKQIQKIVTIGQEIEVIILSVDTEKYRISLGVKQLKSHPYDDIS